jgi:hypothetical protein
MSEYNPPTELIEEARALTRELQQLDLNDGSGGNQSTASASSALIAVAGLAGTAYFFMSDQE